MLFRSIEPKTAGEIILEMCAPLTGEVIPLEQVEDEVFASGVTGLGWQSAL